MRDKTFLHNREHKLSARYSRFVYTQAFQRAVKIRLQPVWRAGIDGKQLRHSYIQHGLTDANMDEDKKVIFAHADGVRVHQTLFVVKLANRWGIKVVGLEVCIKVTWQFAQCMNANVHGTCVNDILTDWPNWLTNLPKLFGVTASVVALNQTDIE